MPNKYDEIAKLLSTIAGTLIPISMIVIGIIANSKRIGGDIGKFLIPMALVLSNISFGFTIWFGLDVINETTNPLKNKSLGICKALFFAGILIITLLAISIFISLF